MQKAQSESVSRSTSSTASTLATVLEYIFSSEEIAKLIDRDSSKELRLTCKATKQVIDAHVKSLKRPPKKSRNVSEIIVPPLYTMSPWPWPNLTRIDLGTEAPSNKRYMDGDVGKMLSLETDVQYLTYQPLLKLKSLTLNCLSMQPLVHSNWPNLTVLRLNIYQDEVLYTTYPTDLKFPIFLSLKKLMLSTKYVDDNLLDNSDRHLAFLGPFLGSCPHLTCLILDPYWAYTDGLASMIASAPLEQLESLILKSGFENVDFLDILFERDWPALRHFIVEDEEVDVITPLSTQRWIGNLKSLTIYDNTEVLPDNLRSFLKAIEDGGMERLTLNFLQYSSCN